MAESAKHRHAALTFHVERLDVPASARLVSDDEAGAYLKRVAEARERLREHFATCKDTGREFVPCSSLD